MLMPPSLKLYCRYTDSVELFRLDRTAKQYRCSQHPQQLLSPFTVAVWYSTDSWQGVMEILAPMAAIPGRQE